MAVFWSSPSSLSIVSSLSTMFSNSGREEIQFMKSPPSCLKHLPKALLLNIILLGGYDFNM